MKVYTDHKNLTYSGFNTEHVMRWHLIIEEYGSELINVKGENNIVVDALSQLPTLKDTSTEIKAHTMEIHELAELYCQDDIDLPVSAFPLHTN